MKILKKVVIIILGIYFLMIIYLFFNQKSMLYFPDKTDFLNCKNFSEEEKKSYENNLKMNYNKTNFYEIKWEKNNVIIFFHWNAGRACDRIKILENLKKTWNTIILVEYFWYADKENSPDIIQILQNVDIIWNYIKDKEKWPMKKKRFDKVYVMWRSLGTWPASYFAWKFETDKLLLISAYDELYKVAGSKYPIFPVKYLFTQNYNSKKYLNNYKNDFLLIHWKKDKVIPYKHWLDLFNSLENKNKKMISLENINHHNIFSEKIEEKIVEYFK